MAIFRKSEGYRWRTSRSQEDTDGGLKEVRKTYMAYFIIRWMQLCGLQDVRMIQVEDIKKSGGYRWRTLGSLEVTHGGGYRWKTSGSLEDIYGLLQDDTGG